MDQLREEFKELLKRSGWNQSEAARNLDLPAPSISRYVNDIDTPSKQTLRLFKMLLMDSSAPTVRSSDNPPGVDWKRRAKSAERDLADLRATLRRLGSSSKTTALADTIEEELACEVLAGRSSAQHKPLPESHAPFAPT